MKRSSFKSESKQVRTGTAHKKRWLLVTIIKCFLCLICGQIMNKYSDDSPPFNHRGEQGELVTIMDDRSVSLIK